MNNNINNQPYLKDPRYIDEILLKLVLNSQKVRYNINANITRHEL